MRANSLNEIEDKINNMKFKKKLVGGVDEADVWRKIRDLDADYQNVFKLQYYFYKMKIKRLEEKYRDGKI